MRKILVCVIVLLLLLCGCDSQKETEPLVSGIKFLAKITYYNEQYECDTVISDEGKMQLTVNSPDTLKGLKIYMSDGKVTAEYLGITYEPKLDNMPFASISKTVYMIITQIKKDNIKAKSDNSNCKICRKCDGRDYEFTFSPSGLPILLTVVNESYKIEFSNVTVV